MENNYVDEKNTKCPKCRWFCISGECCLNPASEFSTPEVGDISYTDCSKCEQYYPNDKLELSSMNNDDDCLSQLLQ